MHDETLMKHLIGRKKIESHPIVVSVMRAHKVGGELMRHSPTLSRPKSKDALGIVAALSLKKTGIA